MNTIRSNGEQSEHGATMIEFAVALPIFFLLLFGVIDFGRISLGFGTVRSAAAIAVRRAAGTERPPWAVFQALGGPTVALTALQNKPQFQTPASPWYTAPAVTTLDPMEVRAIGYANSMLRENIGKIRFPCTGDPDCVQCFTARGTPAAWDSLFFVSGARGNVERSKMLGLECSYNVPIITASFALGILPRFITVRARAYTPVETYGSATL